MGVDWQITLLLVTTLINFVLGLIVLLNNPQSKINRSFFVVLLGIALWAFTNFAFRLSNTYTWIYFWAILSYASIIPIASGQLYFTHVFPSGKIKKWLKLFILASTVILTTLVAIPGFVLERIEFVGESRPLVTGVGIYVYAAYLIAFFWWAAITLVKKYFAVSGVSKQQIKYILLGTVTSIIFGLIFNLAIPLLFKNYTFVALGPNFTFFMVIATVYAIVAHHLMDIRLVVARTVSYILLSLIIITFYTVALYGVGQLLLPSTLNGNQLVISVLLTLIVAYTFQPLRRFLEKSTDRIFFQENYDPQELLSRISVILGSTLELKQLSKRVLQQLSRTFHVDFGRLYVVTKRKVDLCAEVGNGEKEHNISLKQYRDLIAHKSSLIVFDDIPEGGLKKVMRKGDFGCFVQLKSKGEIVGLMALGNKKTGSIYTGKDIKTLEILGPQLAVAIQNALQYTEIQQFSERLKIKIKEATEQLREANSKLKELDKRKDEFISVAAHELRAPLTAVKGYLSMINEGDAGKVSKEVREYLEGALEGAEREIRLVNNMLNVSRIEEGRLVYQMGKCNLATIVKTAFEEFKIEARNKELDFSLNISKNIEDKVFVDQDRIYEVVANFISNAIKYTDKGSIAVTLSQPDEQNVRFEVKDTGYGMTQDEQNKLFQKFFRAESSAGKVLGTGLGLYITKLLIEKFDGKLGVVSEKGKGSTFWFELPVVSSEHQ